MSAELVIVGAGPAGVSTALWARSFGIATQVLEAGSTAGGQLHHIHHPLLNLAGAADGDAATIARAFKDQLEASGAEVRYGAAATALDAARPAVLDASGAWNAGQAVLIATGVRRRRLEVPGERELEGRGVSWSATHDRARFAGEEVVVAGGGDGAYENALLLAEVGCPVTLVVRGAPRARAEFRERVAATLRIDVQEHTRVSAVLGEDRVSAVRLAGPRGEFEVPAAGLVVKAGVIPNTEWCASQVERDAEGYLPVDEQCGTSQP
ncbi:MAG TPA: NAD(P)/FAD-dependent oxidoreductase, partial [Candidatus Eisenbacteria bacterium]|nr:NAD(P)/FAD-dependent oxidoreductase [Candidatus Eisenbacteria bacterium]